MRSLSTMPSVSPAKVNGPPVRIASYGSTPGGQCEFKTSGNGMLIAQTSYHAFAKGRLELWLSGAMLSVGDPSGDYWLGWGTSTWQLSIFGFMPR